MNYDLNEFLEEYDDFTEQIRSANLQLFNSRLKQWLNLLRSEDESVSEHFEWLAEREDKKYQFEEVFSGDGTNIILPENRLDRLSANIALFTRLDDGSVDLLTFCHAIFYDKNINNSLRKMIEALFEPFASEFRRYIRKNFDEPIPEETASQDEIAAIPASDRIVTINHNAPDFGPIPHLLAAIEEDIRGQNGIDPNTRDLALSELRASKEILKSNSARISVIQTLLVDCLKWLAVKFAEYGVSGLIAKLVASIKLYFGI